MKKKLDRVSVTTYDGKVWEFPSDEIGTRAGKFKARDMMKVAALTQPDPRLGAVNNEPQSIH